jgi:hypothetical protein
MEMADTPSRLLLGDVKNSFDFPGQGVVLSRCCQCKPETNARYAAQRQSAVVSVLAL